MPLRDGRHTSLIQNQMEKAETTAKDTDENVQSPTGSQKTISDDDEIDYSVKPEFYDPELDDKDELWVQKKRKGHGSDAVLSCPACFTTLCFECQRHEKYVTQYRAVFAVNCEIKSKIEKQLISPNQKGSKRKRDPDVGGSTANDVESFRMVCCSVCSTEVGAFDENEVYHFFDVIPRES